MLPKLLVFAKPCIVYHGATAIQPRENSLSSGRVWGTPCTYAEQQLIKSKFLLMHGVWMFVTSFHACLCNHWVERVYSNKETGASDVHACVTAMVLIMPWHLSNQISIPLYRCKFHHVVYILSRCCFVCCDFCNLGLLICQHNSPSDLDCLSLTCGQWVV